MESYCKDSCKKKERALIVLKFREIKEHTECVLVVKRPFCGLFKVHWCFCGSPWSEVRVTRVYVDMKMCVTVSLWSWWLSQDRLTFLGILVCWMLVRLSRKSTTTFIIRSTSQSAASLHKEHATPNMPAENRAHVNPAHMLRNLIPAWCMTNSGPLSSPWQKVPAPPSWIDFNRRLSQRMLLPPDQHDGANNNLHWRPLPTTPDLLPRCSDVATDPLLRLVFYASPMNPSNCRCKRSRTPHQNYLGSLTQFAEAVIRAKESGWHPRHVEKKNEIGQDWTNGGWGREQGGHRQLICRPQAISLTFPPFRRRFLHIPRSEDWRT